MHYFLVGNIPVKGATYIDAMSAAMQTATAIAQTAAALGALAPALNIEWGYLGYKDESPVPEIRPLIKPDTNHWE